MTRSEISEHLRNEICANRNRILASVHRISRKMIRYRRTQFCFVEKTSNRTELTIYITNAKRGFFTIGTWYHNSKGKSLVIVGPDVVSFYNSHFFQRYSERLLRQVLALKVSAEQFVFKNEIMGAYMGEAFKSSNKIGNLAVIYQDGVGLGVFDLEGFVVVNTFLSNEMLVGRQIQIVETVRKAFKNSGPVILKRQDNGEETLFKESDLILGSKF